MKINCETTTDSVISNGIINIVCKPILNDYGKQFPDLYRTDLLEDDSIVNDISGKEGELIVSTKNNESSVVLNNNGQLIIDLQEDSESLYSLDNEGNLKYS